MRGQEAFRKSRASSGDAVRGGFLQQCVQSLFRRLFLFPESGGIARAREFYDHVDVEITGDLAKSFCGRRETAALPFVRVIVSKADDKCAMSCRDNSGIRVYVSRQ